DDLRGQLDTVEKTMKAADVPDGQIDDLRAQANDVGSKAQKVSSPLQGSRDAAKARVDQLGPAPTGGAKEPPEVVQARKDAQKAFDAVDGQIKQADAMALEASQTANALSDLRRTRFQERISRQSY